jgi:hypothetical protein
MVDRAAVRRVLVFVTTSLSVALDRAAGDGLTWLPISLKQSSAPCCSQGAHGWSPKHG